MAFSYTRRGETIMGNKRVVFGQYTNDGTSGEIATGLNAPDYFSIDGAVAVSESGGTLTAVLTASNAGGSWMAFGDD